MSTTLVTAVSKSKKRTHAPAEDVPARDRVDLRAAPAWVARVERQAERLGVTLTAYVKAAVSRALEADEATDPVLKQAPGKPNRRSTRES